MENPHDCDRKLRWSRIASKIQNRRLRVWWTEYLRVLANERGSSAHTLRAYRRELMNFALHMAETHAAVAKVDQIEHLHIRTYLGDAAGARVIEGVNGAGAGGDSKLVQVAGARGACAAECGLAGGDAEAAEASAAGALNRADESRGRQRWR